MSFWKTRGYALPIARNLADDCGRAANARIAEIVQLLEAQLESHGPYYLGEQLSALDSYAAAALDTLSPLSAADCPMHPKTRAALEARRDAAGSTVPARLRAHRDFMHREHMPLPIVC